MYLLRLMNASITSAAVRIYLWYFLIEFSSISKNVLLLTKFFIALDFISSFMSFFKTSNAIFLFSIPFSSIKNSSERIEISGFLIPATSKTPITCSETNALSMTCPILVSIHSSLFTEPVPSNFANLAFIAWKNET
jgi:hypothetical protein